MKKTIALLLALAMVFSILPMGVFAEGVESQEQGNGALLDETFVLAVYGCVWG